MGKKITTTGNYTYSLVVSARKPYRGSVKCKAEVKWSPSEVTVNLECQVMQSIMDGNGDMIMGAGPKSKQAARNEASKSMTVQQLTAWVEDKIIRLMNLTAGVLEDDVFTVSIKPPNNL